MSNALSVGPAVMINRIVDRAATPLDNQLAKVAELRLSLETAARAETIKAAEASPTGEADPTIIDSGAVVDRLI